MNQFYQCFSLLFVECLLIYLFTRIASTSGSECTLTDYIIMIHVKKGAIQRQQTVSVYFTSKQILFSRSAEQYICVPLEH